MGNNLFWISVLFTYISHVSAGVISCGGFVHTLGNVDRSQIQVRLLTPEGHQKYEAECNPATGYYMIPIYNKGQYKFQIKAPEGWIFANDAIAVNVDGKNDPCTQGTDIDFKHTGYTISGKVKSGDLLGPRGFKLGLFTEDGQLQSEAVTDADGAYSFKALPGSYVVYNVDQEAQCIERGKVPVVLKNSPVIVQPDITISGHLLSIKITDESSNPLKGARVTLIAPKKLEMNSAFTQTKLSTAQTSDGKHSYTVESDSTGVVRFPCLPPGEYGITPALKTERVELSFEPKTRAFKMGSENTEVFFKVAGFSTSGRVTINNKPIADAAVYMNSQKVATTDNNGQFHLKDVKSGNYKLSANKEHYGFNTVTANLSPSSPQLPTIEANKIDICGSLRVEKSLISSAQVVVESASNQVASIGVDAQGAFCQAVTPGKYAVRVTGIPPVTPEVYNVDVSTDARLNLIFTQFKANVEVHVECLESCNGYKVALFGAQGLVASQPLEPKLKFSEVPPGSYYFTVESPTPTCWKDDKLEFQIEDRDVSGLKLQQTGFKVTVDTDYPAHLHWQNIQKNTHKGLVEIDSNQKSFCVPYVGTYKIDVKSCHVFDPVSTIEVPTTEAIKFVARKAQAVAVATLSDPTSERFEIHYGDQVLEPTTVNAKEQTFNFFINMDQNGKLIELIPHSKTYLFKPASQKVMFDGNCILKPITFDTEKGSFIDGSIVPPVEDVEVTGTSEKDASITVKTKTDKAGKFKIGPISKDAKFAIDVEKEGYKFVDQKNNVFQAIKLSELRVNFIDSETKQPLGEVLASISGVDNYRSNKVIGETGSQNYIGLRPGEYYIVAVLQEYKFENSPQKIVVKEGELVTATLEGKRFAYSIFGKTTTLNKTPIPNIRVEALSATCGNLLEDATSDDNGNYRIRGLKLDCEYRVFPKLDSKELNSYPPFIKHVVKKEDRRNVDFIVTSSSPSFELFGKLNFADEESQPPIVRVRLLYKGSPVQKTEVVKPSNRFFFVNDTFTKGEKFTIVVDDVKTKRVNQAIKEVEATSPFISTSVDVLAKKKTADVVISNNNYIGMIFIAMIALAFMYPEKVAPIMDHLGHSFMTIKTAIMNQHYQMQANNGQDNEQRRRKARKN